MAKSQAQQKDSGQARTGETKSKSDALGQEVESLEQLSALADLSPQVSQLKGISDLAQNGSSARATSAVSGSQPVQFAGKAPAAPAGDAGVSVSLQQELVLLEGELSLGSKMRGFFGFDTTFAQIKDAVKSYMDAPPDKKQAAKSEVERLSNAWLEGHKDLSKKGDDVKAASLKRILKSLQDAGRTVELGVSAGPDAIETDYKAFTAAATGTVQSAEDLYALFQKAHQVKSGIDGWKRQHPRQETPADVQKAKTLTTMEASMATMRLNMWFKPYFAASATGIDMNQLSQGIFSVRNVTVNVTLKQGTATGSMTNVIVGPRGFIFDSFNLSFSGDLQLSDGFKIGAPKLFISSTGDSYSVSAEGKLALSADGVGMVTAFKAGGDVKGGYDFSASQFLDPEIEGGYLEATLFGSIDVKVGELGYRDGVFSAANGEMTVRALEKSVTGTVGGLTYSKSEGVGLTNAAITSTSDFVPVPGFTVSQPKLELRKTAEGWTVHGSGKLSVQMSGAQYTITKLNANVSMDYSVHDKATGFAVESGNMDVEILDSLKVKIDTLGYSSATKKLTAASAGMSLEIYGKKVDATMTGISHAPGEGFDFSGAVFTSPSTLEPVTGFTVSQPTLELRKKAGGWNVYGSGKLSVQMSGAQYTITKIDANVSMDYSVKDGATGFSVDSGNMDVMLFDSLRVVIDNLGYSSETKRLTAATAGMNLDLFGKPVDAQMKGISHAPGEGFDFTGAVFSVPSELEPVSGFSVTNPTLELRKTAGGWSVHGDGKLSIQRAGAQYNIETIDANVSLDYSVMDGATGFAVEKGNMNVMFFDSLRVVISDLGYSSATGKLTAATGSMNLDIFGKPVDAVMNEISYAPGQGFDFKDAVFSSQSNMEPVPGFTVSNPTLELRKMSGGWSVHGSGKLSIQTSTSQYTIRKIDANVTMDYNVKDGATGFAVESGNMDVDIFDSLKVVINELGYSSETGELTAATGTMSLDLYGASASATMNGISYAPGTGFDFASAKFAGAGTFEPLPGFQVSNPQLELVKQEGGWKVGGAGTLAFNLGLGEAIRMNKTQAGINLLYNPKDGNLEDFSLADGSIDLALYDHVLMSGSGIEFDKASGALTIGTMVVTLNNADALGAGSITGGGEQLVVRKGGFDWGSIKLNYNKKFEVGGFSFTPPFAVITKSKDSYQVELNDMQGEVSIGDSLKFAGSANMLWDPDVGGAPEITGASLQGGYSGDLVGDYLSAFGGKLSFSTGFSIPFAAGPVPMEAYVEFGGSATAPIDLKLALDKSGDAFQISGEMGLKPNLTLYIKAGVGVGTSLLIYGGVYVKGELTSTNVAKIGITGSAKASDDYTFDNVVADYELGSDLKANISAGGEVKFLYFFKQELYEVRIKEWPLGESKIEGKYDLLRGKPISETGTKLFDQMDNTAKKGTSVGIPLPDADYHSKSYMAAITRLNNAIDSIAKWNDSDLRESKGPEALARHKTKVTATFERFINTNTKKLTAIEKKMKANDTTMKSFLESHRLWLERQQQKKDKAAEKEKSGQKVSKSGWGHLQTSEHYTKKIDQGNEKYESKLAPKTAAMEKLTREHDLVSEELRNVRAILTDLDSVLSADGTFNMDALISRASGTKVKVEEAVAEAEAVQDLKAEVFDFQDNEVR